MDKILPVNISRKINICHFDDQCFKPTPITPCIPNLNEVSSGVFVEISLRWNHLQKKEIIESLELSMNRDKGCDGVHVRGGAGMCAWLDNIIHQQGTIPC